jgi:hypothetical protein
MGFVLERKPINEICKLIKAKAKDTGCKLLDDAISNETTLDPAKKMPYYQMVCHEPLNV